MADLSTLFLTFNCGRELVNTDFFAASINQGLSKAQLPPDVIVLSLQEIAPLSYSFLGGSFLSPYFERFNQTIGKLNQLWKHDEQYETILCSNVGMTALMLFVKPEVARKIRSVQTAGTGVGTWEMGNKGALGVRLGYANDDDSEIDLTFVAAHLAPAEDAWQRRNLDWRLINENLVFTGVTGAEKTRTRATNSEDIQDETEPLLSSATDNQHTSQEQDNALITSSSYIFFGGDLNYRTSDISPHPDNHLAFPRRNDSPEDPTHYSHMMPNDQLAREKAAGNTLHHLKEAPVNFAPTYKFSKKAQKQAAQAAEYVERQTRSGTNAVVVPDETDWHWAEHRHPSWCDRVLYLALPGREPVIHMYNSLPLQPSSDHKPVVLYASIPTQSSKPLDHGVKAPYPIKAGWKHRREAARRRELVVGIVTYLVMTWEGEALLLGAVLAIVGGWAALRSLLL
ncbi:DNase I-like protein [Aureobasidium pullulans EXF-150]|uniref:DNase I-like protein n=1 Tax=Aureobasidium pullulans EXF-150 TaxID=1043002 RepID=A0A074XVZ1_AURPU|nr:DNase I-like protein [Aureobasidium pullulans EXF-150]KEQ86087.1 DNase I-like protein [Aureobasidium pullulans EXF-150]